MDAKRVEYAPTVEVESRVREVRLLIKIVQPAPEYQPFFVSDESTLLDVATEERSVVEARLEAYLRRSLPLPVTSYIWQVADAISAACPGWPDEWPPLPQ